MHNDRSIIEARVAKYISSTLGWALHGDSKDLSVTAWEAPGEPVPVTEALRHDFSPHQIGAPFGRPWATTWFRMKGVVPKAWSGGRVEADIHLDFTNATGFQSEGQIWHKVERTWIPLRGVHPLNHEIAVAVPARGGERIDWLVEAASNPPIWAPSPNSDVLTADRSPIYSLRKARLILVNDEVWHLRLDMMALQRLMAQLPADQPYRWEILYALNDAINAVDPDDVAATAIRGREALAPTLARRSSHSAHQVSAIGHAHIDSAWLWPLRETVRKCARTFSNVLELMQQYPEFKFGCSQAVQYEWMRLYYPSVFAGIGDAVARGQWIVLGGQWVEADANLPGGESLVRQQLVGQRYFEQHFGVVCDEVWLPDVFGYPANLPQIMRHGGARRFLTQKLSWNKTNRFPHHTFLWEGIDGSSILTHFPPVETYNATFDPSELAHLVRTFTDQGRQSRSVMPFGYGDGGGGPNREMLEFGRRLSHLEGLPRVEIESPTKFFEAIERQTEPLATWSGELYFEMHRGTYTSQARTKVGNRRCEQRLREAELWSVMAFGSGDRYPSEVFERMWREVLLLQFHDILPGTSIGWVHREAEATHTRLLQELEVLIAKALHELGGEVHGGRVGVVNASPFDREGVATLGEAPPPEVPQQRLSDGTWAVAVDVGALGIAELEVVEIPDSVEVSSKVLENGFRRVVVDEHGALVSLFDKVRNRECLLDGDVGNRLELFHDDPNEFDAWDLDHFYRDQPIDDTLWQSKVRVVDRGPLVGRLEVERRFESSTMIQIVELAAGSREVRIGVTLDWQERKRVLKLAFPLEIHTAEVVRDIQFGHVTTPIHTNTSWDFARFEWCAHRFVSLSEQGFGVSLINDGRYGFDAMRVVTDRGPSGVVLRCTVAKGATYPDPNADLGAHEFSLVLRPHGGDLLSSGTVESAYALHHPLRMLGVRDVDVEEPIVSVDHRWLVIETVKAAEDRSGDTIVRLYERFGGRGVATLSVGPDVVSVQRVDGLERPLGRGRRDRVRSGTVSVPFGPFELISLRLRHSA